MANEGNVDNLNKELAAVIQQPEPQQKPAAKRTTTRKRVTTKKKDKPVIEKARRKMAIARASLVPGSARITLNHFDI
ncbi:MAG: hypothetical protein M1286_01040, partial [Candidatus Marsarchaeota archaeon]|nr:hypothetical protein [Candidatus Marsarchaeota archaeon]